MTKQHEEWKDVEGYEGYYQISNYGSVMSLSYNHSGKPRLMSPAIDKDGYRRINFTVNKIKNYFYVHRLVAQAFIPNPDNLPKINHKDMSPNKKLGIEVNNYFENLEWCTVQYNNTYGDRLDKSKKTMRDNHNIQGGKTVIQNDLQGDFIKEWESAMSVQRELGFCESSIRSCCHGRQKTSYGFLWKYKNTECYYNGGKKIG